MSQLNWYPGHMARTRRQLEAQLRSVDAVIELCDARAPAATRNADLDRLTRGKQRLLILNKADLADDAVTSAWLKYFRASDQTVLRFNANGGRSGDILPSIERATLPVMKRYEARGVRKTIRVMVIGIPNVGKSTFINRLHGRGIAKKEDRPGVTRSSQWIRLDPYLELLDTPGMLPPRLEDQEAALLLAYLGSIRDQIMDTEALAGKLLLHLVRQDAGSVIGRFHLEGDLPEEPQALLEAVCRGRGWLLSGGRCDTARGAAVVLDEFRAGRVGKLSLERPPRGERP